MLFAQRMWLCIPRQTLSKLQLIKGQLMESSLWAIGFNVIGLGGSPCHSENSLTFCVATTGSFANINHTFPRKGKEKGLGGEVLRLSPLHVVSTAELLLSYDRLEKVQPLPFHGI